MRRFNTEGPVVAQDHYCIPPLERVNLAEILELVRDKRYFVLHAPRQTGKTSILLALQDLLNGGSAGQYRCVYVNVEPAQAAGENVEHAMRAILSRLASRAHSLGDEFLQGVWSDILARSGAHDALGESLTRWGMADPRPLVLLIDEIDTLIGDSLLSVLRQLRAGYDLRPGSFPQSVVLCGVRDVRDYRIHSGSGNTAVAGGSAFNIKAASLRIGDFTRTEVRALLAQHTEETAQAFTPEAVDMVWRQTRGQPWLANALCQGACFDIEAGRDRCRAITADDILEAQERLILSRQTHLDQLADKLQEDRVRRVVEPLLSGGDERPFSTRDGADGGLHGPLRESGRPSRHLRPKRRKAMGRQDLPPRRAYGRPHHHGVGNVTTGATVRMPDCSIVPSSQRRSTHRGFGNSASAQARKAWHLPCLTGMSPDIPCGI